MTGYPRPEDVFTAANSGVKIDTHDPAFNATAGDTTADPTLPAVYLFSNTRGGDGVAYSMAEDGTVLGSHICSHRGYMRHDLHDRPDRLAHTQAHYPNGYRLVVLLDEGSVPPADVIERNRRRRAVKDDQ